MQICNLSKLPPGISLTHSKRATTRETAPASEVPPSGVSASLERLYTRARVEPVWDMRKGRVHEKRRGKQGERREEKRKEEGKRKEEELPVSHGQ